jgi:hypothetical protein
VPFSPAQIDEDVPFIRIGNAKGSRLLPIHISRHPAGTEALLELARQEEGNLSADMSIQGFGAAS